MLKLFFETLGLKRIKRRHKNKMKTSKQFVTLRVQIKGSYDCKWFFMSGINLLFRRYLVVDLVLR